MAEYIKKEDIYKKLEYRYKYSRAQAHKAYGLAIDDVCDAPTADITNGKWVERNGFVMCSRCGASPANWEAKPNNPSGFPPFCHACGANMREGDNNG